MPNGDGDAGFALYNDPTRSMAERVGAQITEKDALDELAARRTSTAVPSTAASLTPQPKSSDDAEAAALNALQQRRVAAPQQTSLEPGASFAERFSAAPEPDIGAMAKQMVAQKGRWGALAPFAQNQLQRLISEHPYVSTAMVGGMNLPIAAGAAYLGGPAALRLAPEAAKIFGLEEAISGGKYIKQLYHLLMGP